MDLMVDAWQRGVVTWCVLLSLNGARFRVGAPAVTLAVLFGQVVTVFLVALRQLVSENGFASEFFFHFFEASSASGFRLHGAVAGEGHFSASGWVDAPAVAGGRVALFGAEKAIGSASWGVETWRAFTATFFNDLGIARALFFQSHVHVESSQMGDRAAVDWAWRARSSASALDFLASVTVHTPALTSGAVVLGGSEKTIIVALGNVVSNESSGTQSFRALDVADGAFRFTTAEGAAAVNWFTSVGHDAPASADRSVALSRFEVTVFSALRDVFAGHWVSSILSRLGARSDNFGALYGNRENEQERTSQSQKLHCVAAVC